MTLNDSTIAIYIVLDDLLQSLSHKEPKQRQVNDALVLTTSLIASWYFGGNYVSALGYMRAHHCPRMLSPSRFNRRLHHLAPVSELLFSLLGTVLKDYNPRKRYILDTFPLKVCHNIRISRCRLLQGEAFRGKNASKREYFYGYKIAVLTDENGIPVELAFIPGSYSDVSALKRMDFDLPAGSIVWQDSGFTDYEWEDHYLAQEKIAFMTQRRKRSKRGRTWGQQLAIKENRRRIETTFSEITARFTKKIHAVTIKGFQLKVFLAVFAYTIFRFLNL